MVLKWYFLLQIYGTEILRDFSEDVDQAQNEPQIDKNKIAWKITRKYYGCLTSGLLFAGLLCEMLKCLVAEPRPHFLDTCQPISLNCNETGK